MWLPSEILTEIFHHLLDPADALQTDLSSQHSSPSATPEHPHPDVVALIEFSLLSSAAVCHSWRDAVFDLPLWRNFPAHPRESYLLWDRRRTEKVRRIFLEELARNDLSLTLGIAAISIGKLGSVVEMPVSTTLLQTSPLEEWHIMIGQCGIEEHVAAASRYHNPVQGRRRARSQSVPLRLLFESIPSKHQIEELHIGQPHSGSLSDDSSYSSFFFASTVTIPPGAHNRSNSHPQVIKPGYQRQAHRQRGDLVSQSTLDGRLIEALLPSFPSVMRVTIHGLGKTWDAHRLLDQFAKACLSLEELRVTWTYSGTMSDEEEDLALAAEPDFHNHAIVRGKSHQRRHSAGFESDVQVVVSVSDESNHPIQSVVQPPHQLRRNNSLLSPYDDYEQFRKPYVAAMAARGIKDPYSNFVNAVSLPFRAPPPPLPPVHASLLSSFCNALSPSSSTPSSACSSLTSSPARQQQPPLVFFDSTVLERNLTSPGRVRLIEPPNNIRSPPAPRRKMRTRTYSASHTLPPNPRLRLLHMDAANAPYSMLDTDRLALQAPHLTTLRVERFYSLSGSLAYFRRLETLALWNDSGLDVHLVDWLRSVPRKRLLRVLDLRGWSDTDRGVLPEVLHEFNGLERFMTDFQYWTAGLRELLETERATRLPNLRALGVFPDYYSGLEFEDIVTRCNGLEFLVVCVDGINRADIEDMSCGVREANGMVDWQHEAEALRSCGEGQFMSSQAGCRCLWCCCGVKKRGAAAAVGKKGGVHGAHGAGLGKGNVSNHKHEASHRRRRLSVCFVESVFEMQRLLMETEL
ncbi:hypothetical protein BJ742DRAFT_407119 [Cladochytrium replicatum]|nr:hypothetical protein BJ742DRAFT_407119 [Cladochytrium replicatum]